jgi:hypothetical protein
MAARELATWAGVFGGTVLVRICGGCFNGSDTLDFFAACLADAFLTGTSSCQNEVSP